MAAACLVRAGVPVLVLEAEPALNLELRGSTFHPPTLDMLDKVGAAAPLIAQGLVAPELQYLNRADGRAARFDLGVLVEVTRHPYRVQAEQYRLTRILLAGLEGKSGFAIRFAAQVAGVAQDEGAVDVTLESGERLAGRWLIGADGARSAVRRSLGVEFAGFTWPERFLVISTREDFRRLIPELVAVNYFADPEEWFFLLQLRELWRCMFPVPAAVDDGTALGAEYAAGRMARILPGHGPYVIAHSTLYRVHQRVAERFRLGRAFLIGDAAHINNPLGGMGLNGGIHDAVNLTERLARVWHGEASESELDRFERQRRGITLAHIQAQSIANKETLEAKGERAAARFQTLVEAAADPAKAYAYALEVAMIGSLRRAAAID